MSLHAIGCCVLNECAAIIFPTIGDWSERKENCTQIEELFNSFCDRQLNVNFVNNTHTISLHRNSEKKTSFALIASPFTEKILQNACENC